MDEETLFQKLVNQNPRRIKIKVAIEMWVSGIVYNIKLFFKRNK